NLCCTKRFNQLTTQFEFFKHQYSSLKHKGRKKVNEGAIKGDRQDKPHHFRKLINQINDTPSF
ncbi:hypothetical protein ABDI08_27410, partial [Priestia megaterium]|uniref:hypothetical protein n=1 Tax=Priestia megaterium TaxID=1404 RepID=UPI001C3EDDD1